MPQMMGSLNPKHSTIKIILGQARQALPLPAKHTHLRLSLPGSVAKPRRLCKHFLHSFTVRVEGYSLGWTHSFIKATFKTFLLYQHCQEQAVQSSRSFTQLKAVQCIRKHKLTDLKEVLHWEELNDTFNTLCGHWHSHSTFC